MKIFRALSIVAAFLAAASAMAELLPSRTRGLSADSVYQNGNLDHVNLFNGNLSLTLPIGQSYPVSPQLSYRLALVYNSNVWDFDDGQHCLDVQNIDHEFSFPEPARSSNAGVGWSLHFGRLYAPGDLVYNKDNPYWLYVSPDGGQHNFYDKLHPTESVTSGVFYSLDGTYLRLDVRNLSAPVLESPDGIRHTFTQISGRYHLAEMMDPFENWMRVAYTSTAWTVTDIHGRSHTLRLNSSGNVTHADLAAFGGARATYELTYTPATLDRHNYDWPCGPSAPPQFPETVLASLLTGLRLPDNSVYGFTYDTADGPLGFSGGIRKAVLPTGGRIEWDYATYVFNTQAPNPQPNPQPSASNRQRGVGARRTYLSSSGGAVDGSWSYEYTESIAVLPPSSPFIASCWHRMRVSDHLSKQVTESYFATAGGTDSWWYGLPYAPCNPDALTRIVTPWSAGNGTPYLSTRVYERQSNNTLLPIRSTYVIYDSDGRDAGKHQDRNHRLRYQKVVYHDDPISPSADHWDETIHSDFDGLGHYRSTRRTSSFGPEKIVATSYLPSGTYQLNPDNSSVITDGFTTPGITEPWIFGLSSGTTTTQGSLVSIQETCFDDETGFLERKRMLAGTSRQTKDVIVELEEGADFDGNGGFVVAQRIYGGDLQNNVPTGPLCGISLANPEAVKLSSYRHGSITRGAWVEPCNESQEILVFEEASIDVSTGLPSSVVETSGLVVNLDYDELGRLLAEVPAEGASRTHQYLLSPLSYEIRHCPQGTSAFCNTSQRLSDRYWAYDGLGRMVQKALAYPGASGDAQPSVLFTVDGLGRKVKETTWGGAHDTEFKNFDVFGRARSIEPDGVPATALTFRGERIKAREVQIATGIGSLQSVFTTEQHDHHGRLVAVCEAASAVWNGVSTCTGQLTRYSYDQDDRLIKVCQNANPSGICGQERYFGWDGRGFLVSETHPEIGASGGGTLLYSRDARGNITSRDVAVATDDRPLRFTYDGAGRAIKVEEQISTGYRVLKEFFYARANIPGSPERRRGQLIMARRTNWVAGLNPLLVEGGVPMTVTDHYQYFGLGGRVSKKTTSISLPSGGQSFSSEYTYGPLGDIATIDYPSGDWPHQSAPSRTVNYERRLGFLTDVPGYASDITYQLGGMLYEIQYENGVTWRQNHEAATGWERPDSIETFAGSTLLWSTGDYNYDGAGNITEIGTRDYVYDAFSRFSFVRNNGITPNEQVATYDAYGNLTSLARSGITRALTTNPLTNRLQIAGVGYTSNGEMAITRIDGVDFAYQYDGLGQQLFQQSDTKTWLYVYDANDERVMTWECAQNLCGQETTFERYTPRGLGGEVLRTFEGRYRGSLEWKEDYVYRDGQPLAWIQAPAVEGGPEIPQFLHADHLGSTRLVTSAAGTQVSRHDFLPFGEESTAVTSGDVDLKFTGHERDQPGKPHDYMHARFYSPNFGRFLRIDPAQTSAVPTAPQTWNRYVYAANNPLKFIDPDGEIVRVATGSGQRQVKKMLIRTAMRPSGRQDLERMANDKNFTVRFEKAELTKISAARQQMKENRSSEITFGQTTPVHNFETQTYTQAFVRVDTTAIGMFHPDKKGVTTLAHEFHHVEGFRQGLTYEQVLEGDSPSSGTGPAERYGQSVEAEAADISYRQAKQFLVNLLTSEEQR